MAKHRTRSNLPKNVLPAEYDPIIADLLTRESKKQNKKMKKHNHVSHSYKNEIEVTHVKTNTSLKPRTEKQGIYLDYLNNLSTHIVFGIGPAGSGKTYMAAKWAALSLINGVHDKIVISRPAVSVSEKHGFLPGDLNEKMEPWLMPIFDVFKEVFGKQKLESLIKLGKIEIAPLAYMRGRSFSNAVVMLDEAQNATDDQIKMFLTRIGEGCKMIVTGDTKQSDYGHNNGLQSFLHRYRETDGIEIITFGREDIIRHHLIGSILAMYGEE